MRTYEWSETGEEVIVRNYDSAGILTLDNKIGASMVYSKYSSGQLKEVAYLNSDSILMNCSEGYARVKFTYEADGEHKWYYTATNELIRVLNKRTNYLMELQLLRTSVPNWLRKAEHTNKVDGVRYSSLWYELTLYNQDFNGKVIFGIELINGELTTIRVDEVLTVPEKWVKKLSNALSGAYFISRSGLSLSPSDGVISVRFEKAPLK